MTNPNVPPHPSTGPPRRAPQKPAQRAAWIVGGVVVAVFAGLVVLGTVVGKDDEAAPAAPSTSSAAPVETTAVAPAPTTVVVSPSTTAAPVCYPPREIADAELAAFAGGLALPPGVQVITGRVSTQSSKPGKVGVALDLCVPGSTDPDSLRPIATSIAAALKSTDLGARTFALYVSDMSSTYTDEAKLKDGDYALHLWNGKPSAKADLAQWEVVGG